MRKTLKQLDTPSERAEKKQKRQERRIGLLIRSNLLDPASEVFWFTLSMGEFIIVVGNSGSFSDSGLNANCFILQRRPGNLRLTPRVLLHRVHLSVVD